jgi:hypothetical protein
MTCNIFLKVARTWILNKQKFFVSKVKIVKFCIVPLEIGRILASSFPFSNGYK